jgi:hypothetical protein
MDTNKTFFLPPWLGVSVWGLLDILPQRHSGKEAQRKEEEDEDLRLKAEIFVG